MEELTFVGAVFFFCVIEFTSGESCDCFWAKELALARQCKDAEKAMRWQDRCMHMKISNFGEPTSLKITSITPASNPATFQIGALFFCEKVYTFILG
jgi:hypothetical protein